MASTIPLLCNICPKKPRFSDVSHLLTHIASKGHLSHYYKLKVRSSTDGDSRLVVEEYDQWYAEWRVEDLMSERMSLKEKKRPRSRASAASRALGNSALVQPVAIPRTRTRDATNRSVTSNPNNRTQVSAAGLGFGSVVDPQLLMHGYQIEQTSSAMVAPAAAYMGPSVISGGYPALRSQETQQYQLNGHSQFDGDVDRRHRPFTPGSADNHPGYAYPEPPPAALLSSPARVARSPSSSSSTPFTTQSENGELVDRCGPTELFKLKGVRWEGMGQFDAALPENRRKRNQKKDPSVVVKLEEGSLAVLPMERVLTPNNLTFTRERLIDGHASSSPGKSTSTTHENSFNNQQRSRNTFTGGSTGPQPYFGTGQLDRRNYSVNSDERTEIDLQFSPPAKISDRRKRKLAVYEDPDDDYVDGEGLLREASFGNPTPINLLTRGIGQDTRRPLATSRKKARNANAKISRSSSKTAKVTLKTRNGDSRFKTASASTEPAVAEVVEFSKMNGGVDEANLFGHLDGFLKSHVRDPRHQRQMESHEINATRAGHGTSRLHAAPNNFTAGFGHNGVSNSFMQLSDHDTSCVQGTVNANQVGFFEDSFLGDYHNSFSANGHGVNMNAANIGTFGNGNGVPFTTAGVYGNGHGVDVNSANPNLISNNARFFVHNSDAQACNTNVHAMNELVSQPARNGGQFIMQPFQTQAQHAQNQIQAHQELQSQNQARYSRQVQQFTRMQQQHSLEHGQQQPSYMQSSSIPQEHLSIQQQRRHAQHQQMLPPKSFPMATIQQASIRRDSLVPMQDQILQHQMGMRMQIGTTSPLQNGIDSSSVHRQHQFAFGPTPQAILPERAIDRSSSSFNEIVTPTPVSESFPSDPPQNHGHAGTQALTAAYNAVVPTVSAAGADSWVNHEFNIDGMGLLQNGDYVLPSVEDVGAFQFNGTSDAKEDDNRTITARGTPA